MLTSLDAGSATVLDVSGVWCLVCRFALTLMSCHGMLPSFQALRQTTGTAATVPRSHPIRPSSCPAGMSKTRWHGRFPRLLRRIKAE